MMTITEMKIARPLSLEPIESMSCCMEVSIANMKALGLFDLVQYKYIKHVIDKDTAEITTWIKTKQATDEQKTTTFSFNLHYDELNVKSFKVDRPYANASKYEDAVKKLVKKNMIRQLKVMKIKYKSLSVLKLFPHTYRVYFELFFCFGVGLLFQYVFYIFYL